MSDESRQLPLYKRTPRGCAGIFLFFAVLLSIAWGSALGYFVAMLDDVRAQLTVLDDFRPKLGSKFYADPATGGELLGEYTTDYRHLVQLNQIPLYLQKAFIATEDHKFYEHHGVRPDAIFKAIMRTLRSGKLHGGSTITQQVVRNLGGKLVGQERTIHRKIKEALLALQLERAYTKDEILELYLNQLFLGGSAYGVEAASRQYFGKRCDQLTLSEAATLAGLTRSPNKNRPDLHPKVARIMRNNVLELMLRDRFISRAQYEQAIAEPIRVITPEQRAEMMAEGKGYWGPNRFLAPYFVEEVRRRIMRQMVSKQELLEGGLEIYTTLDLHLQRAAEEVLFRHLDEFDKHHKGHVSGALVCIDNRPGREGFVRALVGGRNWEKEKFNTATQARRQPGSSVKPFVWTAAIANGMTPSDVIMDKPFVRIDASGNVWRPKNFDGKFTGPTTLRRGLERSRNIISIRLVERFTMPLVRSYMIKAGIRESQIPDSVGLTIALGTPAITVLEQCVAYSTFAKNGTYAPPVFVKEIRNPDGYIRPIPRKPIEPEVIPANVAYVINYMLQGVAQWGTGAASRRLGRPRAGKTGTTNDNRDAWFCGFTPDYTTVVWVGYRDNHPLGKGRAYTGGHLACPIWTDFMIKAEENLPVRGFKVPKGVVFYNVDRMTGLAGGSFKEAFIEGTHPPTKLPEDDEPQIDLDSLLNDSLLESLQPATDGESTSTAGKTSQEKPAPLYKMPTPDLLAPP